MICISSSSKIKIWISKISLSNMISESPPHRRPAAPWAAPDQLMAEVVGPTPEFWEVACSFSGLLWFSSSQYVTITTHITIISIIITTYSRVERLQVFFGGFFDSHHLSGDLIPVPRKIETQNKRFESFKLRSKVVKIYTFWCSGFSTLPFLYHHFSGLKIIAKPEGWLSQIGHEPRL